MRTLGYITPAYMPSDPDGDGFDNFAGRPMESQLGNYTTDQIDELRFSRLGGSLEGYNEICQ